MYTLGKVILAILEIKKGCSLDKTGVKYQNTVLFQKVARSVNLSNSAKILWIGQICKIIENNRFSIAATYLGAHVYMCVSRV